MSDHEDAPSKGPIKPRTATRPKDIKQTACLNKPSANDAYLVLTYKCPACGKKATFLVWPDMASCVECGKDFKISLQVTFL